jgi:hypothetical protein
MNVTELVAPETLRKFTADMERTSRALQEAALRVVVPESSVLAQMATQFVIPEKHLHQMLEQAAFVPKMQIEALTALTRVAIPSVTLDRQFFEEMQTVTERLFEVMRDCRNGADRLARSGWTLPIAMSPGQMLGLIQMTDDDAIDCEFVAAYHEEGGLGFLRNELLASERLKDWRPLLEQCLDNYESGKHLICIPALLSVLEGAIARPDGAAFVRADERVAYFQTRINAAEPDSLDRAMWNSMNTFIALLYERSDFGTARPAKLNRHWILHGRDVPFSWRQADALRLFHALTTLSALCN